MKLFFEAESPTDKVDGAANILRVMVTPGTKHTLYSLNYVLPKINIINRQFQSEGFQIHKVYKSIRATYREILSLFICDEVIHAHDLTTIDPTCKLILVGAAMLRCREHRLVTTRHILERTASSS